MSRNLSFSVGGEDGSYSMSSFFVNCLQCEWLQVEELVEVEASGDVARERWDVAVAHVDMVPGFWRKHPYIFNK